MSFAWMNGQYQQVGPPSQSTQAASQLSHDTMRNQQTGTANTSNQYMTAKTGAQLPQNAKFTHHYRAHSKTQPSNWQTSAVPHLAVSFQQTAGGNNYLQYSPTNLQNGNPSLQATYGLQLNFHQNSAQNSEVQSQPNVTLTNIVYTQQGISANWNQSVEVHGKQPVRTQNANVVSDRPHCRDQNSFFYNLNGEVVKIVPTTATSPQHGEVVYNGTLGPAHNNNRRQNGTQHGFTPPSYNEAISQSFRNDSKTTNSSSGHNFCVSSTSQISQQYPTHNNGGEATSSINSNSYNRLSKPSDSPLNPAVDAQQEMLRCQKIARIEDYLRNPFTAGSVGGPQVYTSSPSGQKQNMQPVTSSVTEICNANAAQSIPQNSEPKFYAHSLPKTTRSVNVPPQQSSVPNVFATREGIGNVSQAAFFPENIGSLSDAPQLMKLLKDITPQRNGNQSSAAKNCEMLSVKAHDSSIHSSPGHRAVAVVQPLLQESYQVASKQTSSNPISQLYEGTATDKSLSNPKNKQIGYLKVGPDLHPENPNQMRSNKYAIRHLAASNDGTFMSLSSSTGPQDLLQKQLCTVDARSKLDIDTQVHQRVAPTAQQSVASKAPVSQNGDKDKSEMPRGVLKLSSVPTTPWTPVALTKYIQDSEKAQTELKDFTMCGTMHKLLSMFWNDDTETLKCALKTGIYNNIMTDVKKFCNEHVSLESDILFQVKSCFGKQLNDYHVLKDKEFYSELPYKSSWLNVNKQLDDIDKEFDFPQSLKQHHLLRLKSDSQPDQVETEDNISAQTVNEVSNKVLSSTELEQVDPSEEKHDSSDEATSTQTASPNKTQSSDSSDPYSFKIQVFPPKDAKVIFAQAQSNLPSMDMDYQPERASNSSVEGELPKVIDATLSNSKLENKTFCPIEEVCCIEMLKETILGLKNGTLSKCQCNIKQSNNDITAKTLDEEVTAVQEKDATEGENQAKGGESVNDQVIAFHWPEISNVFSHNIDFSEDDPHSDKDPKNIEQISIDSSQSSIIFISDDEEHLPSSESEIPNEMPDFENDSEQAQVKLTESGQSGSSDEKETNHTNYTEIQSDPEVECVPEQMKSTGSMQSCSSDGSDKKTENLSRSESEVASPMTDLEENCGKVQLTSTNVAESSLETEEEQTQFSATGARQKTRSGKRKRSSCPDRFLPVLKKSKNCESLVDVNSKPILESASKCGSVFVHATDSEPSASNDRTVELVLFGSTPPQDKCVLGSRKHHISSLEAGSEAVPRPPNVLTVNLSPLNRKTIKTWEYSFKRLCKKWKIRLPPAKTRHRSKLKAQKCTFASPSKWSLKKADRIGPADTEELPVSSRLRILRGKTKPCLNLRWRKSLTEELKCEEEKTEKHTVMLNQPAAQERNNVENGSNAILPLQNNDTLKFSVLPVSFNFGSNGIKETEVPVPGKLKVEGKDNSHNKTVMERGSWYPIAENERPFSPATPKTYSLFHTFQKKYMKKMQPNVDN